MKSILLVLLLVGCSVSLRPVPPDAPQPDGPGDCATACARLHDLGGCGVWTEKCETDCADVTSAEEGVRVAFPVGCLTAAKSCEETSMCK